MVGILNAFKDGLLAIKDQYSFDPPPIQSEKDWKKLVEEFLANSAAFADEVAQMPDERLDEVFVNEKYGNYLRNIEGVIEHSYYHFGPTVLINKLILAATK